jgi:hypothetical protein
MILMLFSIGTGTGTSFRILSSLFFRAVGEGQHTTSQPLAGTAMGLLKFLTRRLTRFGYPFKQRGRGKGGRRCSVVGGIQRGLL